jgi:hypothetical protein
MSKRDLLYERILLLQRDDRSHGSAASVRTAVSGRSGNASGETNRVRRTKQSSKEIYYVRTFDSVQNEHLKREEERNTKRKREEEENNPMSQINFIICWSGQLVETAVFTANSQPCLRASGSCVCCLLNSISQHFPATTNSVQARR